jgi:hypothetical protein
VSLTLPLSLKFAIPVPVPSLDTTVEDTVLTLVKAISFFHSIHYAARRRNSTRRWGDEIVDQKEGGGEPGDREVESWWATVETRAQPPARVPYSCTCISLRLRLCLCLCLCPCLGLVPSLSLAASLLNFLSLPLVGVGVGLFTCRLIAVSAVMNSELYALLAFLSCSKDLHPVPCSIAIRDVQHTWPFQTCQGRCPQPQHPLNMNHSYFFVSNSLNRALN